jgi:hypothetical protein
MRPMTKAAARRRAGIAARTCAWVGRHQRELSDRVHAAGDERALQNGWDVTSPPGGPPSGRAATGIPASTTGIGERPLAQRMPVKAITPRLAARKLR